MNAFTTSGRGSTLVVLIMGLTACGIALTALLSRAEDMEGLARLRAAYEQQRMQLREAVEHGRMSEVRLQDVERRNELLQHGIVPPSGMSDEAVLQSMKPSSGGALPWFMAGVALIACGAAAVVYLGLYRPAQVRLRAQNEKLALVDQSQATALAALRAELDKERASVVAELEAERAKNVDAARAVEAAQTKLAVQEQPAATAEEPAKAEPSKAPVARATKRKPARSRAKAPAAPAASTAPGVPELDRKISRALRDSDDNDPIGGL